MKVINNFYANKTFGLQNKDIELIGETLGKPWTMLWILVVYS